MKLFPKKSGKLSITDIEEIYLKEKNALLKFAYVLVSNAESAEDIVADVFVGFARAAGRKQKFTNVKAYLTTAVLNKARNYYRDSSKRQATELDDELFNIDVPEGYMVQQGEINIQGSEEAFIAGLKMLAELSDDQMFLPDVSIEYVTKNAVQIGMMIENTGLSDEEQMEMGMQLGQMMTFLRFFGEHGEGQWYYAGDGVKLGDSSKAIFWYQPKDSDTWRVIYGDLSVKNVNEEDLPN